jgi:hypothetical protein
LNQPKPRSRPKVRKEVVEQEVPKETEIATYGQTAPEESKTKKEEIDRERELL